MKDEHMNNAIKHSKEALSSAYDGVKETAEDLYNQTRDKANSIYHDGKQKIQQTQDNIQDYTDQIIVLVKDKPLASLLVAGGIGFVIAALLRK